ncbi:hypothetical protein TNIN_156031 [Trichonephila inaurata madagascariensis]|uniref:Uncharacterized protein n=1 Tax=Trichonephila inaurata madagascariensis TaxID=2747483 RepID=A0A8X7CC49_9ARAC|nr:hypothetical protein TNIN_156031 [Trichonephila inaurata madagascariensis]
MAGYRFSSARLMSHLSESDALARKDALGPCVLLALSFAKPGLPKYGKFTEDCIPDGVFPIGNDVFVFASTYYDSVSVHIRRFKKYGKTYYPTPEGITLDPRWIEYIMRKKKVPESLEELPSGLFPPERYIQITSERTSLILL